MVKSILTEKRSIILNVSGFSWADKEMAWKRAKKVLGRDPARWRRDIVGNVLFKMHTFRINTNTAYNFDYIIPKSKGGKTIGQNC